MNMDNSIVITEDTAKADQIAMVVLDKFDAISKPKKRLESCNEWTILAGIVLDAENMQHENPNINQYECVSLA